MSNIPSNTNSISHISGVSASASVACGVEKSKDISIAVGDEQLQDALLQGLKSKLKSDRLKVTMEATKVIFC